MRPQLDLPRELIVDRGDVASTAGVPILEPCAADVVVLLVASHVQLLHLLFCLLEEVESACPCTHQDDLYSSLRAHELFFDLVAILVCFWRGLVTDLDILICIVATGGVQRLWL